MTSTTYLLISSQTGHEEVHTYSAGDMAELYTAEEQADLAAGKSVISDQNGRSREMLRSVDMLVAARSVVD